MISDLLEIGDEVVVNISSENRGWGYNPCPDGTWATVVAFAEICYGRVNNCNMPPGVYENRCWADVRLEDGKDLRIGSWNLMLRDDDAYQDRVKAFRQLQEKPGWDRSRRLRDLPATPFWEGDHVLLTTPGWEDMIHSSTGLVQVQRIEYDNLSRLTNNGSAWPAYTVGVDMQAHGITTRAENMELVERGLVWRFYNGASTDFGSLIEEINFFRMLGRFDMVPNPRTKEYVWTRDELREGLRQGLIHDSHRDGPHLCGVRYREEDLGRRVADIVLSTPQRVGGAR